MARHKKHPPHEEHADESWLVPYADLLTLLLALFIVLFATATPDESKYEEVIQALYQAFGGQIPDTVAEIPDDFEIFIPTNPDGTPKPTEPTDDTTNPDGTGGEGDGTGKGIGSLMTALDEYVHANNLESSVSVDPLGENILVTLKNDVCFESGSKQVTNDMKAKLSILAQILRENQDAEFPFEIIVAGHTDNVPMKTPGYTNWDLSVDRALECMRLLINDTGLDPAHFSVRGYGELQPVDTNDTAEGRLRNRRVEVLISQPKIVEEDVES